jgi:probable HAF family extracellular repeat protein
VAIDTFNLPKCMDIITEAYDGILAHDCIPLTLGGDYSYAADINKHGQIVGHSTTSSGSTHTFLWRNGVMNDLGALETYSQPLDINDRGQIVGFGNTPSGSAQSAGMR